MSSHTFLMPAEQTWNNLQSYTGTEIVPEIFTSLDN